MDLAERIVMMMALVLSGLTALVTMNISRRVGGRLAIPWRWIFPGIILYFLAAVAKVLEEFDIAAFTGIHAVLEFGFLVLVCLGLWSQFKLFAGLTRR